MQDSIAIKIDLRHFVRDEQNRETLIGKVSNNLKNSLTRANIDTDRGSVEYQKLWVCSQPLGNGDLLLVAARQG